MYIKIKKLFFLYTMNTFLQYAFYFIFGGLLFCLLQYFSKHRNVLICAIIPAIPILFLTGLFCLYKENQNLKQYTIVSIKTIIIYLLFLLVFVALLNQNIHVEKSLLIGLCFFFLFYLFCFYKKWLK